MYTAEASVNVNAAPQTAWEYVSNYQNFDQFMPNIKKIELLSGDTSEWHLSGPLGIPVSWQAITTTKESPKHLAWHSTKGTIDTKGFIKIEPNGSGSKITVHMEYQPPLGAIGEAFGSQHAICIRDFALVIAQKRKLQAELLGKGFVRPFAVGADAENGGVTRIEFGFAGLIGGQLQRTHWTEIQRIKQQHDAFITFER